MNSQISGKGMKDAKCIMICEINCVAACRPSRCTWLISVFSVFCWQQKGLLWHKKTAPFCILDSVFLDKRMHIKFFYLLLVRRIICIHWGKLERPRFRKTLALERPRTSEMLWSGWDMSRCLRPLGCCYSSEALQFSVNNPFEPGSRREYWNHILYLEKHKDWYWMRHVIEAVLIVIIF